MYDDLIKALRKVDEYDSGYAKLMYDAADAIEELSRLHEAQRQNLITLMNEDPEMEWILVTERLPEPYTSVLLYSGEELYTGYMHSDKRFTVNASHFPDRPTHWMPLPSAPEPSKEET